MVATGTQGRRLWPQLALTMFTDVDYSLYGGAESTSAPSESSKPSLKTYPGRAPRRVFAPTEGPAPDVHAHSKPPMDSSDFLWLMTEEPHRSRRTAIMKAHPEVRPPLPLRILGLSMPTF